MASVVLWACAVATLIMGLVLATAMLLVFAPMGSARVAAVGVHAGLAVTVAFALIFTARTRFTLGLVVLARGFILTLRMVMLGALLVIRS